MNGSTLVFYHPDFRGNAMDFTEFDENFSLAGKTALVTGAGAGIGQAIAMMFGRKGAKVILADMNEASCEETKTRMAKPDGQVFCLRCDVSSKESIDETVAKAAGVALGIIGYLFYLPIFGWLGVTPEIFDLCESYLLPLLPFVPALMLQMLFQSYFVAAGKPGYGLCIVALGGIANIVLYFPSG